MENDTGISGLIKKIQQDGIDCAEKIKNNIIETAKMDALKIVKKAKKQSENLLLETSYKIVKLKEQVDSELRMSVRDFILSFSDQFKNNVVLPIVSKNILSCFDDPEFIKKCLFHLIKKNKSDEEDSGFSFVVSNEMLKKISDYFASSIVQNVIKQKIQISSSKQMKGFSLRKNGNNYFWDFTVGTITEEIVKLIEPSLRQYFVPKIVKKSK